MTEKVSTTSRDDARFLAMRDALIRLGVELNPLEDALSSLAAAVYEHGGSYGIDAVAGSYRAEIRPAKPLVEEPSGTGFGAAPEVALAFALIDALSDDGDETFGS